VQSVTYEATLDVPADKAWSVLSDFGGFLKWAGEGTIKTEGEGEGMVRHLEMPGFGKISEKASVIDGGSRTLVYELVGGNPIGMSEYRCTVKVEEAGEGKCKLSWKGEFDGDNAILNSMGPGLQAAYAGMSQGLAAYVQNL
jgi:hypothetical protein